MYTKQIGTPHSGPVSFSNRQNKQQIKKSIPLRICMSPLKDLSMNQTVYSVFQPRSLKTAGFLHTAYSAKIPPAVWAHYWKSVCLWLLNNEGSLQGAGRGDRYNLNIVKSAKQKEGYQRWEWTWPLQKGMALQLAPHNWQLELFACVHH